MRVTPEPSWPVPPSRLRASEDRLWPVVVALGFLGATGMGSVLYFLPLGVEPWWRDAATWLVAIPVATVTAALLARLVPGSLLRRTVQAALTCGLAIHILLFIASIEVPVFVGVAADQAKKEQPRRREPRVVHDYQQFQLDPQRRQQQDFAQPVATQPPEPTTEQLSRQEQPPSEPTTTAALPTPTVEMQREITPAPIEKAGPQETRPQAGELANPLSRRATEAEAPVSPSLPVPSVERPAPPEPSSAAALEARSELIRRTETPQATASRVDVEVASPNPSAALAEMRPEVRRPDESPPASPSREAVRLGRAPRRTTVATPTQTGDLPAAEAASEGIIDPTAEYRPGGVARGGTASGNSTLGTSTPGTSTLGPLRLAQPASGGTDRNSVPAAGPRASGLATTPAVVPQLPPTTGAPRRALTGTGLPLTGPIVNVPTTGEPARSANESTELAPSPNAVARNALDRTGPQRNTPARDGSALGSGPGSGPGSGAEPLGTAALPPGSGSGNLPGLPGRAAANRDGGLPDAVVAGPLGGGIPRTARAVLPGSSEVTNEPSESAGRPPRSETDEELQEGIAARSRSPATARNAGAGPLAAAPLNIAAPEGRGGLGAMTAGNPGLASRLASPDSNAITPTPSRFQRRELGGAPQLDTSAVFSADAFRRRDPTRPGERTPRGPGGLGPQTEEAIERGLAFLARRQLSDGSWTLRSATEPAMIASDTAATGLCLLAFQGAGYNHREHQYAARLRAALDYLVTNQRPNGDLFLPVDEYSNRSVWLYSHGIAAIALCEAYGMTQDPSLQRPAQRALDFIVQSQDPVSGGWRYQPRNESDTSVTGWMMMALKSGQLAGLKVPEAAYVAMNRWLDLAQGGDGERHLYRYNPHAPDTEAQRHGRIPSTTMTAVGLLLRLYGGWRRDQPAMIAGADYLRSQLPAHGTPDNPLRDTYYWYYGTQVMFHMGGEYWDEWNGRLHPLLVESQIQQGDLAGSWSPRTPLPDRWGPQAGRLYVTTMNLLSLEVTYRHLPLYVDTGK